jgi:hypothetical protein
VKPVTGDGWRKSSYSSGGQQGSCVEVARGLPGIVTVRDSKDPHGPVLTVTPDGWASLTELLRATA